jgi:protein-tyrosine phosphatase
MGGAPVGTAPPQFDHFVAVIDGVVEYRTRAYQTLTVAQMVDCEFIPDVQLLNRLAAIISHLRSMGPTLVHCQAGLNRSGLVVAYTLMADQDMPAKDVIALLRLRRHPQVLCNPYFEKFLLDISVK